ncbi:TonB-dependent receptor domain-containing protein [Qipengyuania sp. MTN3-11]|uniref:TonB-dependent receptor domain-containing protein n=1 Tax=Qipengyuania sp. MTN3-11 TaxID=3056557 RepID=UPI0036F1A662
MRKLTNFRIGTATVALAIAMASSPSLAQDASDDTLDQAEEDEVFVGEPIVVTGSRIVRPEIESSAPLVAAIGEEELEQRAFTNVADAINEVPGFGTPVSSSGDQSSFSVGQNFVNLFGIGSQRTLTLVNGRRFVSSNTASNFGGAAAGLQVDLNVIPVSLVERIDVLAVKGATTYGSDAIAGTVNLILKDDFEGFEATGQMGIFEEGYGKSYTGSITAGGNFADGRGNIAVNFEYAKQDGVLVLRTEEGRRNNFRNSPTVNILDRRIALLTAGGRPSSNTGLGFLTDASGTPVQFAPNGNLVPFDVGDPIDVVSSSGGDGLILNRSGQILSDLERYSLFTLGHYDLTDNVRFFFEANYSRNEAVELANQPVYQSALFGAPSGALPVYLSNPFLNAQARGVLAGSFDPDGDGVANLNFDRNGDGVNDETRFFIQRAGFDLLGGSNANFQQLELFRGVGGFDGDFEVGDRNFYWSVSASYGESQAISSATQLVQANFVNAVDAVRDPTTGEIVCRVTLNPPTGAAASTNAVTGCVPLNLFGEGAPSQAAIDFVTAFTNSESRNRQTIFNANIGGGLFDLFDNEIAFNVGAEYRKEEQGFTPDAFLQEGLGRSVAISPVTGEFDTREAYAEVLIPIIQPSNDMFIDRLEFDASVRYIDNSRSGSDVIYSVGGQFAPIRDITLRGSYTESVRSPAITELFLPIVETFSFANDPCDVEFIGEGDATRAANCAADGLPANFDSVIDEASQRIRTGGNPNLANETSKSWTACVILQPRFVPGLTITADWVDIEVTNAITALSLTNVLRACYDSTSFPTAPTCSQFTRGPDGQIIDALTGQSNAGLFEFSGLQASARYGFGIGDVFGDGSDMGDIDLALRYFYRDSLRTIIADVENDNRGEIGNPIHSFNGTIGFSKGPFSTSLTGTYVDEVAFDLENDQTQPFSKVGDYLVFSLTLGFDVADNFKFQATVNNLFNEGVPFPAANGNFYSPYGDGFLGREYVFRVSTSF